MKRNYLIGYLLFGLIWIVQAESQAQQESGPFITISGEVIRPLRLNVANLRSMQAAEVKTKDSEGRQHIYKGVKLSVLLDSAKVTLGRELRGENLTKSLLLTSADGYEVVYSLAEIDPEFTDNMVLLAYEVDGNPLPGGEGPFRIIAPADKRAARWIRELNSIKVLFPKD